MRAGSRQARPGHMLCPTALCMHNGARLLIGLAYTRQSRPRAIQEMRVCSVGRQSSENRDSEAVTETACKCTRTAAGASAGENHLLAAALSSPLAPKHTLSKTERSEVVHCSAPCIAEQPAVVQLQPGCDAEDAPRALRNVRHGSKGSARGEEVHGRVQRHTCARWPPTHRASHQPRTARVRQRLTPRKLPHPVTSA